MSVSHIFIVLGIKKYTVWKHCRHIYVNCIYNAYDAYILYISVCSMYPVGIVLHYRMRMSIS
jgi:hypothetical protein